MEGLVTMSQKQRAIIQFYGTSDEYGCFSNFACSWISLNGRSWPTVEHYFQAQKFAGTDFEEAIRQAKSPTIAKRLGRSRKFRLRRDWERVKDAIMREAVLAKFTQHAELQTILLSTEDAVLVEHTRSDDYWGDGGDGHGKNKLGRILMSVRDELLVKSDSGAS
jgi:ribA/ribD-fused uncharacterized protein